MRVGRGLVGEEEEGASVGKRRTRVENTSVERGYAAHVYRKI